MKRKKNTLAITRVYLIRPPIVVAKGHVIKMKNRRSAYVTYLPEDLKFPKKSGLKKKILK